MPQWHTALMYNHVKCSKFPATFIYTYISRINAMFLALTTVNLLLPTPVPHELDFVTEMKSVYSAVRTDSTI